MLYEYIYVLFVDITPHIHINWIIRLFFTLANLSLLPANLSFLLPVSSLKTHITSQFTVSFPFLQYSYSLLVIGVGQHYICYCWLGFMLLHQCLMNKHKYPPPKKVCIGGTPLMHGVIGVNIRLIVTHVRNFFSSCPLQCLHWRTGLKVLT